MVDKIIVSVEPPSSPLDDFYNLELPAEWSFQGQKIRIVHCAGALESFYSALESVKQNKIGSLKRQMKSQVEKLADTGRLSNQHFPVEGRLPGAPGRPPRNYKALKRIPIRGYCWHSERYPGTIFISHYVSKDYEKLKKKDTQIVGNNWTRIEENGDER